MSIGGSDNARWRLDGGVPKYELWNGASWGRTIMSNPEVGYSQTITVADSADAALTLAGGDASLVTDTAAIGELLHFASGFQRNTTNGPGLAFSTSSGGVTSPIVPTRFNEGGAVDNVVSLGSDLYRFQNGYFGGTIRATLYEEYGGLKIGNGPYVYRTRGGGGSAPGLEFRTSGSANTGKIIPLDEGVPSDGAVFLGDSVNRFRELHVTDQVVSGSLFVGAADGLRGVYNTRGGGGSAAGIGFSTGSGTLCAIRPRNQGLVSDNTVSLGGNGERFRTLYATIVEVSRDTIASQKILMSCDSSATLLEFADNNDKTAIIRNSAPNIGNQGRVRFYDTTGEIATVSPGGNTTYVATTIMTRAKGDARYQLSSSRRYKENIAKSYATPDAFWDLDTYDFTFGGMLPDDDPRRGLKKFGLIAEDVHAVFPEAVTMNSDEPDKVEALDPAVLIGALFAEVKRLRGLIQ
jgi:hypothetical protein